MFDNIGGKIKSLASVIAWIGIIITILSGIVLFFSEGFLIAILVAGLGSLSAWIGSFMQYGFGQLIENSDYLVKVAKTANNSRNHTNVYPQVAPAPPPMYQPFASAPPPMYQPMHQPTQQTIPAQHEPQWICYSCGHANHATAYYCTQCSTNKSWSEEKQKNQTPKTYENYVIGSQKL